MREHGREKLKKTVRQDEVESMVLPEWNGWFRRQPSMTTARTIGAGKKYLQAGMPSAP